MLVTLRRALGAAIVLAVLIGSSQVALAGGGLMVSPVIIDTAVKKNGDTLPPIKVTNAGDEEYEITVEFLPLGHDLDGTPTTPSDSYKYTGHKMLSAKKPRFTLAPGQSSNIEVKVTIPAGRTGGAYAAMYVLGKPKKKQAESITSYVRVGVIIELALPGAAKRQISPGKIYAYQEQKGAPITMHVGASVRGDVHEKIGGVVVVQNEKGAEVAKINLEPANVFPGFTRNIKGTWKAPASLPKGKYKLIATLSAPGLGNETAYGTLEVVNPGEAAQHRVLVTRFQTPPVVQKKPVVLEAAIQNKGNHAFAPAGRVVFYDVKGEAVGTARLTAASPIAPNQKGTLKGTLDGGLPTGKYTAKLEIVNDAEFVLANFTSTQQVIEREVKLAGKISKLSGPTANEAFVTVEFTNESNVEVDCEGVVTVADSSGNEVGMIPLEKQRVAANAKVSYKRGLPEGLEPGLYELRAVLNYGGSGPANQTVKYYVK